MPILSELPMLIVNKCRWSILVADVRKSNLLGLDFVVADEKNESYKAMYYNFHQYILRQNRA